MRPLLSFVLGTCVLVADGCYTASSIDHVWRSPDTRAAELTNVVALFPWPDGPLRRAIEDELVEQMAARGMRAVAGYTVLTAAEIGDRERAAVALTRAGYDGVVSMRAVQASERLDFYPSLDLYWRAAWGSAVPRALAFVRMQVDAYAVSDRRLVWSATSNSVDPRYVRELVDDVTKVVSRELDHQRVILARK